MSNEILNNNIILIGFMATGKSSVGKQLAVRLKMNFIDTDQIIEEHHNLSVDEIFATVGEGVFRDYEHRVIRDLDGIKDTVISTGGGAIAYKRNFNILHNLGYSISLIASADTILKRLQNDTVKRPLLNSLSPHDQILSLLQKRAYYYMKSDLLIDTDFMLVDQVVDHIYEVIYAKKNSSKNR